MTDERRTPPPTDEGWYALHDFRTIDWSAWQEADEDERERAIEEGTAYFERTHGVNDGEGSSSTYAVAGHKADLLTIPLRPTLAAIERLERQFERTALASFTEQPTSYVSVTEASGYSRQAREYFRGEIDEDSGLARYIQARLFPSVPEAEHVCFYPMDKRRDPEYNWYDLPFDERADHIEAHGEIGRDYAGQVSQMITGSIGLDDHEWGVTLWADNLVDVKDLLYEMRFDPSTSKFAEFGPFYVGRRMAPGDLDAYLAGEEFATGLPDEEGETHHEAGSPPPAAGGPHGEDVYAVVLYSDAEIAELFEEVEGLRQSFDHYDTHVKTAVYEPSVGDGETAVVSIWATESAADTAAGFLTDLPGIVRRAGESDDGGWGTMGMFYTVADGYREDFVEIFEGVADVLTDMDGHVESNLLANHEDGDDMFIDSRWASREDAMEFFRSEAFADTVDTGRNILAERPRHVFLA